MLISFYFLYNNSVTSCFFGKKFDSFVGAVYRSCEKLESSAIPLLASPQGGVDASSRKFREATEADADGVVFLLFSSENHPVLS